MTSASYEKLIALNDPDNYGAGFVSPSGGTVEAAEARLIADLTSQRACLNIHTTTSSADRDELIGSGSE